MPECKNDMKIGSFHETLEFGRVEVIDYVNAFKVRVRFSDTGFEVWALAGNVRNGSVKDRLKPTVYGVGFFGDGPHGASKGKKPNKAYKVWQSMLQRCYDSAFHARRPSYIGCSVCNEWHNFQCFADWFNKNYPNDGGNYQLDKDIIKDGNKIYSPETCKFVTLKENTIKAGAKSYSFISPDGVRFDIYNLSEFSRKNGLDPSVMSKLGKGRYKSHKKWRLA